ncbi:MAG: hypothetical protein ACKO6K_11415 [Chitinophagaceae bacterium]
MLADVETDKATMSWKVIRMVFFFIWEHPRVENYRSMTCWRSLEKPEKISAAF